MDLTPIRIIIPDPHEYPIPDSLTCFILNHDLLMHDVVLSVITELLETSPSGNAYRDLVDIITDKYADSLSVDATELQGLVAESVEYRLRTECQPLIQFYQPLLTSFILPSNATIDGFTHLGSDYQFNLISGEYHAPSTLSV